MTYEKRILSVRVKANVVHTKIKNLCTSFDFAEAMANTASPNKVRWGKNLNFREGMCVGCFVSSLLSFPDAVKSLS